MDLSNGSRSILTDGANPASGPEFSAPESITLDTSITPPRALLIDTVLDAVIAIDLSNGNRTVLSDDDDESNGNAEVGTGIGFRSPQSIILDNRDPDNIRALVTDTSLRAIIAVD